MKLFVAAALASLALAAPVTDNELVKRQRGRNKNAGGGGNCGVAFVFARGSTEPSPIVS
jgi:hypothetical protein